MCPLANFCKMKITCCESIKISGKFLVGNYQFFLDFSECIPRIMVRFLNKVVHSFPESSVKLLMRFFITTTNVVPGKSFSDSFLISGYVSSDLWRDFCRVLPRTLQIFGWNSSWVSDEIWRVGFLAKNQTKCLRSFSRNFWQECFRVSHEISGGSLTRTLTIYLDNYSEFQALMRLL